MSMQRIPFESVISRKRNTITSHISHVEFYFRLRAGWSGGSSPDGGGNFSLHNPSRPVLGPTQPPVQWVPGAISLGVKWPENEADHSPPCSTEVKYVWSYTSTPQYAFKAWYSVKKHRDNFTFTLPRSKHPALNCPYIEQVDFHYINSHALFALASVYGLYNLSNSEIAEFFFNMLIGRVMCLTVLE
jgi:hypothetical protein